MRGHVAIITKPTPHYVLTKSTISGPLRSIDPRPFPEFSPCVVIVLAARLAVCLLYLEMPLALSLLLFSVDVHV